MGTLCHIDDDGIYCVILTTMSRYALHQNDGDESSIKLIMTEILTLVAALMTTLYTTTCVIRVTMTALNQIVNPLSRQCSVTFEV